MAVEIHILDKRVEIVSISYISSITQTLFVRILTVGVVVYACCPKTISRPDGGLGPVSVVSVPSAPPEWTLCWIGQAEKVCELKCGGIGRAI